MTDARQDLTWEQVGDALEALAGSHVTVRVVERSHPEVLVAVFEGRVGSLSHAKHPALFWPVQCDRLHAEASGFYLHRDRFQGAVGRAGRTVLVIAQDPVLINIRQL